MSQFKGSQDNINLEKSLDYFTQQEGTSILKERIAQLSHNGKISLSGLDFTEIARLYNTRHITISDVNKMLSERKSYSSLENRCTELAGHGLVIVKKVLNGGEYFVEAMRP